MLKVGVVDDDVGQGTRFDLGEIHSFGHAVTAAVHAGRFLDAFGSDVAGDATAQRDVGVCLEPDALFPAVVVLRAERED